MYVARALLLLMLIAAPGMSQQPAVTHFGASADGFSQYSGVADSQRVIIRDMASWRRYWSTIHSPFIPAPAVPDVDFSREMVVLVAMGTRPSGGFIIRIDSVTADADRLVVQVTRIRPGRGCAVPAVVTQPVDLVRLPATSVPVVFTERVEQTDCSQSSAPDRP